MGKKQVTNCLNSLRLSFLTCESEAMLPGQGWLQDRRYLAHGVIYRKCFNSPFPP